jgi:hypothetical protein
MVKAFLPAAVSLCGRNRTFTACAYAELGFCLHRLSPVCRPPQSEIFRNLSPFSMAKNPGTRLFMLRFRRKSLYFGPDLKSGAPRGAYGFDSRPRH